jgi:uracil-DNA glycosylase family protein
LVVNRDQRAEPGTPATELIPPGRGLKALREAAAGCRACPLWRDATQTVFGAGPASARIMLVGEVPGDQEDRAGEPFVGPAGRLLDEAVDEAGLDHDRIYVTNAVKHFKFKPRGKRRIHQTPSKLEVEACRPWLDAELRRVRPHAVGLLGATAAKALLGPGFRVSQSRGELLEVDFADAAVATYHPSSVLRGPPEEREEAYEALVADLRVLASTED